MLATLVEIIGTAVVAIIVTVIRNKEEAIWQREEGQIISTHKDREE